MTAIIFTITLMRTGVRTAIGSLSIAVIWSIPLENVASLKYRKIPSRERSMRCRPCREYRKPLFKILPRREPCAEITLLTTTSEPRREGSLTHFCLLHSSR